jgi:hypothetical protein
VQRDELAELHFITLVKNVPSILKLGILSHNGMAKIDHESIATAEIQDRRAKVKIPGGSPLHDYANLYFHARNPMMYKRRGRHREITVLRISPAVLDIPCVVITDGNASSGYIRFAASPDGLAIVDRERTFALNWTSNNLIEQFSKACGKCAEVLVPDRVDPSFILGAYVSNDETKRAPRRGGSRSRCHYQSGVILSIRTIGNGKSRYR